MKLRYFRVCIVAAAVSACIPAMAAPDEARAGNTKVPQGDVRVVSALRPAASTGDASAMLALGAYYEAGKGVPKSIEQAMSWYRKAMDTGNADAAYQLSRMYEMGLAGPSKVAEGDALFKKAALAGSVRLLSDIDVNTRVRVGRAGVSDDQAAPVLLKAANAGDVGSMVWLKYYYGKYAVTKNPEESQRWHVQAISALTKLADAGDPGSMETLGNMLLGKWELAESDRWYKNALDVYELAASAGDIYSMLRIAEIHTSAIPGRPYYGPEKSFYWYKKAAEAGSGSASRNVALCYETGRGVPKNLQLAMSWYEKAVQQGDAKAAGWSQATQNAENERIAQAQAKAEQGGGLSTMMQLLQLGTAIANNYYGVKAAHLAAPLAAAQTSASNRASSGNARAQQTSSTGATGQDTSRESNSQPTVAQRTACIFENRTNSNDYSEAVARATLQKEINGVKALTQNAVGDPARYLSDSGINCQKEATNINPEYKCVVSIKTEVKLLGPCGNSGPTMVRSK